MASVSGIVFQPVSTETVRFSALEFNDRVRERIEALSGEDGISKEDWELTALAVFEVFCKESPYLLNTSSFCLLKRKAEESICGSDRLGENPYLGTPEHPKLKQILSRVMSIYDEEFCVVQKGTLNEENIDSFRMLYSKMLDGTKGVNSEYIEICRKKLSDDNQLTSLDYRNIVAELPMEVIAKRLEEYGVIQLRPIDPTSKTLIIGCGNGRNCCGGSGAFTFERYEKLCDTTHAEYHREYSLEHNHPRNIVTIDPNPQTNPTICAHFGYIPLAQIFEGQKFDRIIFEGYFNLYQPPYQKSDVEALLSGTGKVYLDQGVYGPEPLPVQYEL